MKTHLAALGFVGLMSIGSAHAGNVIFDTITGQTGVNANFVGVPNMVACSTGPCVVTPSGTWAEDPGNAGYPWNQGGNGGIAQSFAVSSSTNITKIQFGMSSYDTGSQDSFMVYLMSDVGGTATTSNSPIDTPYPSPNGAVADFTGIGATLIGTFTDASLTVDSNAPHVFTIDNLNIPVTAGEYWIGVVGPWTDYGLWWYNADDGGIGTAGQNSFAFDPTGEYMTYAAVDGAFQMAVETTDAPEPATLAVLGAGLAGLGLIRRRKAR